jgi:hypothetical protein
MEHSNAVKDLTDEQIERSIELIKEMIAQREQCERKLAPAHGTRIGPGLLRPARERPGLVATNATQRRRRCSPRKKKKAGARGAGRLCS